MSTPCQTDPELWWSDDKADVTMAKEACAFCPEKVSCLAKAEERGETSGVWGGEDFKGRNGRRRRQDRRACVPMDETKQCERCNTVIHPKPDQRVNEWKQRRFCTQKCANNRPRQKRSS